MKKGYPGGFNLQQPWAALSPLCLQVDPVSGDGSYETCVAGRYVLAMSLSALSLAGSAKGTTAYHVNVSTRDVGSQAGASGAAPDRARGRGANVAELPSQQHSGRTQVGASHVLFGCHCDVVGSSRRSWRGLGGGCRWIVRGSGPRRQMQVGSGRR